MQIDASSIAALIVLILTVLGFVAYVHPREFSKIAIALLTLNILIYVCIMSYNFGSLHTISAILKSDIGKNIKYSQLRAIQDSVEFNPSNLFVIFMITQAVLLILWFLPELGIVKKSDGK